MPYTPASHPPDLLHLLDTTVRTLQPEPTHVPAISAKLVQLAHEVLSFGKYHSSVDRVLPLLWNLLTMARPTAGCLTGVHVVFLEACLITRNLQYGMSLVEVPITDVTSCPLKYMDYLGYHYLAGMLCIGLKQWTQAKEMLQTAVSMPGSSVSAVQIAAHKKLVLVNLILTGKETNYAKFVNQQAITAFGTFAAEYADFAKAYAAMDQQKLTEFLTNADVFRRDQNYGLLLAAYEAIPARKVIKLTETYVKMDMGSLARRVSEGAFTTVEADEAERLVVQLVTQKSLFARITHPTEGPAYVEFTDDPEPYRSSGTVDVLGVQTLKMQEMASVLARMEQSLSLHEAWLKEAIKRDSDKRGQEGLGFSGGVDARQEGAVRGVGSNWADVGF
ncbi:hypothetical protein NCC49_003192 [Naganishia albida]|nr:hypothetical protein NCC49_003192 [Naganishia albida]